MSNNKNNTPSYTSVNMNNKQRPPVKLPLRLQIASFMCGAGVMILELTGSRLVAPFFGTSLIVWTALIGVMMISLCLGNYLGGYLADKRPENKLLGHVLMLAAIITALTAFIGNAILTQLSRQNINIYIASLLAAVVIFTPASVLMGMTSPIIARLAMRDVSSSGSIVGRLSALNSAGSICGTFLGGFVLISVLPSNVILMALASGMALLSMIVYIAGWAGTLLLALALGCAAWSAQLYGLPMTPVGVHIDTHYNHITIVESHTFDNRRVRIMRTDPDPYSVQSLIYTDDPNELVSDYTKFYDLAFHFNPNARKILMFGGGGYCVPRHVLHERNNVSMDVVEIDPGITQAAQKYFDLDINNANLKIFHEDARTFINRNSLNFNNLSDDLKYDAVFMDVFNSWYSIPFHMTTQEAAANIRKLLKPNGLLIMNILTAIHGPRSKVFHGIYSAFAKSFPVLMIFPASAPEPKYAYSMQNVMLVALCSESPNVPADPDYNMARLLANQWRVPFTPEIDAFTDQFAPVERYALVQ
ncbi:MAG: fused MFS/spermidine synthase [Synergistaceae bacterium]|nr:fused MFS/spermidine synthase [Synergistaceae bacterium]